MRRSTDTAGARARRRPRSGRAAAAHGRASSCRTGSGCRRDPSCALRAPRRRPERGRSRRSPDRRTARPRAAPSRRASCSQRSLTGRDVELEQTVRRVGVVVEEALAADLSFAPRTREPAIVARERAEQELAHAARRLEPVGPLEPSRTFGQRREREPVPRCEHLVVETGLRPLATAFLEQPCSELRGSAHRG